MNLRSAQTLISGYLQEQFGKVVSLRGVRVQRQAAGRVWVGDAYRLSSYGDIRVGSVLVDEAGEVRADFGVEELIAFLAQVRPIAGARGLPPEPEGETLADLVRDGGRAGPAGGRPEVDEVEEFFAELDTPALRRGIRRLLRSGTRAGLLAVRDRLPQLLSEPEGRGDVLRQMAELELLLADVDVGLTYLEAAARELADRADLAALERVAARTAEILGEERAASHPTRRLLDQTRRRVQPILSLDQAPVLQGLEPELLGLVEAGAEPITVLPGEVLIREEETPVWSFILRSGVLSVWIEARAGGARFVRCCFPGELVGESAVLGGLGASATATLRANGPCELWRFAGFHLRALTHDHPRLGTRIEDTGIRHRLDSFFSAGDAAPPLDVRVRDRLLSCLAGIRALEDGDRILAAGTIPDSVFLVAEGQVAAGGGHPPRQVGPDAFVGLRNALHQIPLEAPWHARGASRVVAFDARRLRALASSAPAEVLAVLEALEP